MVWRVYEEAKVVLGWFVMLGRVEVKEVAEVVEVLMKMLRGFTVLSEVKVDCGGAGGG